MCAGCSQCGSELPAPAEMSATPALTHQAACYAVAYPDSLLEVCSDACESGDDALRLWVHFIEHGRASGHRWGCTNEAHRSRISSLYTIVDPRPNTELLPSAGIERARSYLTLVYPMGSFVQVDADQVVDLLRSLARFYDGPDGLAPPWELIEPEVMAESSRCNTGPGCRGNLMTCGNGVHDTIMVTVSSSRTYGGLVPCVQGDDCVQRLRQFNPYWAYEVETRRESAFLEVMHLSTHAWWSDDPEERPEPDWASFIDPACRYGACRSTGGAGVWYVLAPGSGVFYHAGITLSAPTKLQMLARLLERWLKRPDALDSRAVPDLYRLTEGSPAGFLAKLRAVENGMPCRDAQLASCYEYENGDSFTISTTAIRIDAQPKY